MKISTYVLSTIASIKKKIEISYKWQKVITEEIGVIHHRVHIINFLPLSKTETKKNF